MRENQSAYFNILVEIAWSSSYKATLIRIVNPKVKRSFFFNPIRGFEIDRSDFWTRVVALQPMKFADSQWNKASLRNREHELAFTKRMKFTDF